MKGTDVLQIGDRLEMEEMVNNSSNVVQFLVGLLLL